MSARPLAATEDARWTLDKLNTGEKIAGVSAVLLFIFMFFDWFGVEVSGAGGFSGSVPGAGGSAWDALDFIPIVLVVTIVAALVMVCLRLTDSAYEPPISMNAVVAVLGGLSVLLDPLPDRRPAGLRQLRRRLRRATRSVGIFLGLIAAAGIAYGGYSAMQEEGITFGDTADSLGGGGSARHRSRPAQTPPPPPPPPSRCAASAAASTASAELKRSRSAGQGFP